MVPLSIFAFKVSLGDNGAINIYAVLDGEHHECTAVPTANVFHWLQRELDVQAPRKVDRVLLGGDSISKEVTPLHIVIPEECCL